MMIRKRLLMAGAMIATTFPAISYAQDAQSGRDDEQEIVVTGQVEFFRPVDSTSSTGFNVPLVETPQSVFVITNDLFELKSIKSLTDITKISPSLVSSGDIGFNDQNYTLRGFDLSGNDGVKRDGLSLVHLVAVDLIGVERIEVVRGPTAILFGESSYGGVINVISKQPSSDPAYSAELRVGPFDSTRLELSAGGPVAGEAVSFRVDAAVAQESTNLNGDDGDRVVLVPALGFNLGESTRLTVRGIYQDVRRDAFIDGGPALELADGSYTYPRFIPRDFVLRMPGDEDFLRENADFRLLGGYLSHKAGDNLDLNLRASYSMARLGTAQVTGFGPYSGVTPTTEFYSFGSNIRDKQLDVGADALLRFDMFGQEQQLRVSLDHRKTNRRRGFDEIFSYLGDDDYTANDLTFIDPRTDPDAFYGTEQRLKRSFTSASAQLLLKPAGGLTVLLGGRYSHTKQSFGEVVDGEACVVSDDCVFETQSFSDKVFLPRAGLVYEFAKGMTVYASYSKGYIAQFGTQRGGGDVDAETGEQFEGGLKAEFLNGQLGASLAAFSIKREGVAVDDPTNGIGEDFVVAGLSQRHRGVEAELYGRLLPNLNVVASYAYLDAVVTGSLEDPSLIGARVESAPEHQVKLFAQYELPATSDLNGLSFGAGVTYISSMVVNDRLLNAESQTVVDANIRYTVNDRLQFQINGSNLTNDDSWQNSQGSVDIGWFRIRPRSYTASVKYSF